VSRQSISYHFFTGSVLTISPGAHPSVPTSFPTISFGTGSFWGSDTDRTGQLVRDGEDPVWLVRESNAGKHTLVNKLNEEKVLGEFGFEPWGSWRRVAG
jgi:hypothetical protein